MAAVQFAGGKCHGSGEAKAMIRHADTDERLNDLERDTVYDEHFVDNSTGLEYDDEDLEL